MASALLYSLVLLSYMVLLPTSNCACPESTGVLHRLGDSRFYIIHNLRKRKDNMDWEAAKKACLAETGFRMATLEKLTTFNNVARELEKWTDKNPILDTWYWLDAQFDEKQEAYTWGGDPNRVLTYTNYYYRYPRPTGVGSQVNWQGQYEINSNVSQCLALALPLPGLATTTKNTGASIYGHSASFDERPCISKQKRHTICEYTAGCEPTGNDPFSLSEDKDSYFEEGNWIIGNRLYVVNWKPRSQKESSEYCKKQGMKLMNPKLDEQCLIPQLKMWSRIVTLSQFWTEWSYKVDKGYDGKFYDASGTEKALWRAFANTTGMEEYQEVEGRSNKYNKTFCVTLQLSYEFKNTQIPCPGGQLSACNWNFIQYVPSNCNNYQGTICQHTDNVKRTCEWNRDWIKNPNEFLKEDGQATVEFGYLGNVESKRSRYKQTFGSLICPQGYKMARHDSIKWYNKPPEDSTSSYLYDYHETYWVVDEEGFNKDATSQCTVSEPEGDGFNRKIKKVPCTEWHFYICEKRTKPTKPSSIKLPYDVPEASGWNEERHARIYPIL